MILIRVRIISVGKENAFYYVYQYSIFHIKLYKSVFCIDHKLQKIGTHTHSQFVVRNSRRVQAVQIVPAINTFEPGSGQ